MTYLFINKSILAHESFRVPYFTAVLNVPPGNKRRKKVVAGRYDL